MRTLYLCRHAKSSWADAGMRDHDRPLNERGLRNAPFMAAQFKARQEPIDLIVSSTALRAITTARSFAHALGLAEDRIVQNAAIYHAELSMLMRVVNDLPNTAERIMLFGHNPGFTYLLDHLADAGVANLPTCGLVRIDLHVDDWRAVSKGCGSMVWFDYPKRHPGQS
ncbi:MAG: histidine phosphatase family protein [Flavobacteriales bacterium]